MKSMEESMNSLEHLKWNLCFPRMIDSNDRNSTRTLRNKGVLSFGKYHGPPWEMVRPEPASDPWSQAPTTGLYLDGIGLMRVEQ